MPSGIPNDRLTTSLKFSPEFDDERNVKIGQQLKKLCVAPLLTQFSAVRVFCDIPCFLVDDEYVGCHDNRVGGCNYETFLASSQDVYR